ncbi:undecaprenyl diphosphate synthase family protein, partial [Pelagibacteraceae bacterium]|nr:undecaprenyl diphosphate synthase family protein [Pelagibacteraceae bacterium]
MPYSLEKINHVAIIMDGNGRWAKRNSVKKKDGHYAGINTAIQICKSISNDSVINNLTLYTFSTENWKRSPQEIKQLFELIDITYKKFKDTAMDQNIKIVHLGKKNKLPIQTINIVNDVVKSTKMNDGLTLNIA